MHKTQSLSLQPFLIFPILHPSHFHTTFCILSLKLVLRHFHLSISSLPKTTKMSQSYVSTPSKHLKEQSNPKNIGTEINPSYVITDVVPFSTVLVHATPMRKDITSSSRKGKPSKVSTFSTPP